MKHSSDHSAAERGSFSNRLGYVLAVAGSAVGLGNIWRFPYLAAKYGGGMFLLIYLLLVATFGYTLIVSETAIGRATGKSPVGAFQHFGKSLPFRAGGWINAIVPMLIAPYYAVIGGWVAKYLFEYFRGGVHTLAQDTAFTSFISNGASVEFWFVLFTLATFAIVIFGVEKGIERMSRVMMPMLLVLAVCLTVYSVTRPGAMEGVKYFLIPNFKDFSLMTVVAAMGQMFYSLSIGTGILYTYGSYMKKDVDIEKSTAQVEIFDTVIAVLAGLMIIPAVFAFSGGTPETLQAGPSLMFITIPKVFESMGMGTFVGIMFFLLVLLAALTSSISLMETSVSTFSDELGLNRKLCCVLMAGLMLVLGSFSALGFNVLDFVKIFGMSILDFFDFLTNSLMMPLASFTTCLLILRTAGISFVEKEVLLSSTFRRRSLYRFFIKYLVLFCLIVVFVSSIANVLGLITL